MISYTEGMSKVQRSQKQSGGIRRKKTVSLMEKIEKAYGKDFAVRSGMNLETFLKKAGYPSLGKMFK